MDQRFPATAELTLRILPKGGKKQTVACGDIKTYDLTLTNFGWQGSLEFNLFDDEHLDGKEKDEFYKSFIKSDLLRIELDVKGWWDETVTTEGEFRPAVTLRAIVTRRSVRESALDQAKISKQLFYRTYRIEFADAAKVLWGQHRPCDLYADKSMQTVLKKHVGAELDLQFDGADAVTRTQPIIFFALDPSIGRASFYDFVIWWADRHRLIFNYRYDTTKDTYSILERKVDHGKTYGIFRRHVATQGISLDYPEISRYDVRVLDSFNGGSIGPKLIPNDYAAQDMRCDTLLRTPLQTPDFDERAQLERSRLVTDPWTELTVTFNRFPSAPLFPGDSVQFTDLEGWNADSWQYQKECRVIEVRMTGVATHPEAQLTHGARTAEYAMTYHVRLEQKKDLSTPRLPRFVEPTYPVHVEGKILSSVDGANDLTYDPKKNKASAIYEYRVQIPLWKENAPEIPVPYNPGRLPGQMFFPAYKDERVVMALTWRKAWIESFVDWRQQVGYPSDLQGNHMLLGKHPKSRTSIINYYEKSDPVPPVFELARTHDTDQQKIRISEGKFRIEIREGEVDLPVRSDDVDQTKQY